uniref:Protein MAK10 homolog n=1 Tax=Cacopsylla melanoneura TaxID=428564 RepID=A0A8D9A5B8_9HEMI
MSNHPSNNPISTEPNYNWVDITKEFFESIKYLELGELLHDEFFGLFEAMSAIEMMDPKMDAGMICNRGNNSVMNFDKAVTTGVINVKDIPLDVQIGVIDETYSCLVSWLGGHSLAQTLFTNIYLHKPHSLESPAMKAFAICIHKLIDVIRDFVNRGVVYEEEDFQPMLYGYRLLPDVCSMRTVGMLRELEDTLSKLPAMNKTEDPNNLPAQQIKALSLRIKFSRLLYQCFLVFNKIQETPAGVGEIQKILATCSDLVPLIISTIPLGTPAHNGKMVGFDPLVNQRLLPPTFPRYTKIRPRHEAYEYLSETLTRLKHVCKITNVTSNYQTSLDLFVEVSRLHPCLISRSVMQLLYMPRPHMVHGSTALVDVLRETVRSFIGPPFLSGKSSLPASSGNGPARDAVETFLQHCVRPFAGLIQMCGHNRARQRDRLGHLLEEFAALQDEAERVDAFLHTVSQKADPPRSHLACFGTWILYYTLRIINMYLLAGFELELYSVHEYYYIYWYLYEFLYAWLISALTRADNFLTEQEMLNEMQAAAAQQHNTSQQGSKKGGGGGSGGGQGKKNKGGNKNRKKTRACTKEIVMYQALQNVCGGYFKALLGFSADGKLPSPPYPEFSSERVRYEHRFYPLSTLVTPPHMQYTEFLDSITHLMSDDSHESCVSLYIAACKHFHSARSLLESIVNPDPQVLDLIRIMKTNFVVVKLFATGGVPPTPPPTSNPPDGTTPPARPFRPVQFDFSVHSCYPIFKL